MGWGWRGKGDGSVSWAAGNESLLMVNRCRSLASPLAERPTTNDPRKLNILQVHASHSGQTHSGIQIGRVSGIASRFRSPDTGGSVCAVAVSHFCLRAMFFG